MSADGTAPVTAVREKSRKRTDLGNAERFVDQHGADVRHCADLGRLHYSDGTWHRDRTNEWTRRATRTVRSIYKEAAAAANQRTRGAISEWARKSEAAGKIAAMTSLAESAACIAITTDELDRDPWLFNVRNGTIDLRTGKSRPHNRADLITKMGGTIYIPGAECPTFRAFLEKVLAGDRELISFVQRYIGYSLTGDVREQVLLFAHGQGSNGKSTFIETTLAMHGSYAMPAAPGLLIAKKHEAHPTELADLRGARLVSCVEVGEGKRFDEERVKALTGGDTIKARYMRENFFSFTPSHKLILAANHRPSVRGTDHAIWRRILLVPFNVTIADSEKDRELSAKLRAELPGILRWAVEGCLAWQRDGLRPPAVVTNATKAYRVEQDVLGHWIAESCVVNHQASGKASALYSAYREWCRATGEHEITQTAFGLALGERGFERERDKNGMIWRGIGLSVRPTQEEEPDPVQGYAGSSGSPARTPFPSCQPDEGAQPYTEEGMATYGH